MAPRRSRGVSLEALASVREDDDHMSQVIGSRSVGGRSSTDRKDKT